jgi:hypothetical protein
VLLGAVAFVPQTHAAAITDSWTFNGTHTGSGVLTYDATSGLVSAFSGAFDGEALTFWDASTPPVISDRPASGQMTYHGVPNTGGVDYIFDDLFPLTVNGILVSTGAGASQAFFDISLDSPGATLVDFFSVTASGVYVSDNGTFTIGTVTASAAAPADPVPEPGTWAVMLLAIGGLVAVRQGSRRKSGPASAG